jgi:lipid-A-disaccharide synthase
VRIFFSVGEPSGDLHGANLIRDLQQRHPGIECVGFGGPRMKAVGCEIHFDLTSLAVMWIGRVLWNIRTFFRQIAAAETYFREQRPDAVVLIDYPGFNWHIARKAKEQGIPVFYYGVPQLWAWAPWRVKKMQRTVDHALCKLPFEETWFRQRGVNATFIGHPYFDEMDRQTFNKEFLKAQQARRERLVTLLPGSRKQEVLANLPSFLKTATLIQAKTKNVRFAIAAFNEQQAEMAEKIGCDIPIFTEHTPELIRAATACLACSGSVSLELMWHTKPTVVHYKTSRMLHWLGHRLMTVKYITLVNILADPQAFENVAREYDPTSPEAERVPFPEYPTYQDKTEQMAQHLIEWLNDPEKLQAKVQQICDLKERYAHPGASQRAAEYILKQLPAGATKSAWRQAG